MLCCLKLLKHWQDDEKAGLEEQINKIKIDYAGLEVHEARMKKAFMLFGKYYRGLWD